MFETLAMLTVSRRLLFIMLFLTTAAAGWIGASAFAVDRGRQSCSSGSTCGIINSTTPDGSRRGILASGSACLIAAPLAVVAAAATVSHPRRALAYTPDPDPLRESLYLLCRVQEATCLQERYIQKKSPPIQKMKLTLRLVDRSYRLLDQINYVSKFMDPNDIVMATQVGNEAADSLQDAIDFVYGYQQQQRDGDSMTSEQKEFLLAALTDTREKLFAFFSYLPDQQKLREARARVEEENRLNADEFDPDLANDAGIYNPVELPWKNRGTSQIDGKGGSGL